MKISQTSLPGVLLFEPQVFGDDRGMFVELYHSAKYAAAGVTQPFVQDNWSRSIKGTLRGLHFQQPRAQGKLVTAIRGAVFDVAVDIRRGSPHFGKWYSVELSEENKRQLWVPPGFAHGFCVTSDRADVLYKCTELYAPEADHSLAWNDPALGIDWPLTGAPLLSKKDAAARPLAQLDVLPADPRDG